MKIKKKLTGRNTAGEQTDKGFPQHYGQEIMQVWSRADGTGDRTDKASLAYVGETINRSWLKKKRKKEKQEKKKN